MGIVKVEIPGDFEITIKAKNLDEAIEKIKEIKNKRKHRKALEFLLKNAGKLKEEDLPSEEEVYTQGD